jgi:hypothetical protein
MCLESCERGSLLTAEALRSDLPSAEPLPEPSFPRFYGNGDGAAMLRAVNILSRASQHPVISRTGKANHRFPRAIRCPGKNISMNS